MILTAHFDYSKGNFCKKPEQIRPPVPGALADLWPGHRLLHNGEGAQMQLNNPRLEGEGFARCPLNGTYFSPPVPPFQGFFAAGEYSQG